MTFRKQIGGAAVFGMAMVIGSGLSAAPAQAAYIVTLAQVGSNVVATGSGTLDTAGLGSVGGSSDFAQIDPSTGEIITGPALPASPPIDIYTGVIGPASFGTERFTSASSGSGNIVGINASANFLFVPSGYVSGGALADSATYDNQTFSSLGATPGTYVYRLDSNGDTFTVQIGAAPVLEPASLVLLGTGLLGLVMLRGARSRRPTRNT